MQQKRLTLLIGFALVILAWVGWALLQPRSGEFSAGARLRRTDPTTMGEAMTEWADEAKSHIQGGIGIAVTKDPLSGWLRVMTVVTNSPALAAGLKPGDLISEINGAPLAAVPLTDAVTQMRGIKLTTVDLTIRHDGDTNIGHALIRRVSFKQVMLLSTGGR